MKVNVITNKVFSLPIFHEGLRFAIAGLTTTIVCWGSIIVFVELFHFHYLTSNNLATLIAWFYAYFINKCFVFRNHQKQKNIKQVGKFVLLQALLLGWTNLVLYILVGYLGMHYAIIVIGNAVFLIAINFLCQKIFVFTATK